MSDDVKFPSLRIGNQTAFSSQAVMDPFEFAIASEFRAFEFFPDRGYHGIGGWAEDDLVEVTRRWIRETAAAKDIELTVHASLEFNPLASPDDKRLHSTVRFAQDIGATLVNLHLDATQGADTFVEALSPTLKLTAAAGLKLAIENTVWTGPEDFNAFFNALRSRPDLPSGHTGMCLDLGHANLSAGYRNDYLGFVDALAPEVPIIHLHLHENWGDRDSHLTLFTGPARESTGGIRGLIKRLARRRFQGCAILEQWPQPAWQLTEARDRLLELLESHG